jgi:phage terminase small subunit
MLDFGGMNHTRAAMAAGYEGSVDVVKVTAHRLAHDPKIQDAIDEEAAKRLKTGKVMAVNTLLEIMESSSVENKDRLKAVEMLMNRTGMHATSEHKTTVTHRDETSEEVIEQIKQFSKAMGIDPKTFLGVGAGTEIVQVEEAEFEEVDENGIEDLL